jgi:transcriptional regulator with XRE-family HTH domain
MQREPASSKEIDENTGRSSRAGGTARASRAAYANPGSLNITGLAAFLRARRNALRLTQQSLARKLNVRASHIALLESGRRRPSLGLMVRLAAALDVDGKQLLQLAYPEIETRVSPSSRRTMKLSASWQRIFKDNAFLARYRVTRQELEVLQHLGALGGKLTAKRFLAILLLMRNAP